MEKVLELYKYIDGVNDTKFPSNEEQLIVGEFRYDAKRMGGAPMISFTAMHRLCLDDLWGKDVYATFNGERYYIRQTPTSSYSNADARYKHDVELVSERVVLDNVYFYDVVSSSYSDKPVSNSAKFSFFGDIEEYVTRLNNSLTKSNLDYRVVIDSGVVSSEELVSFENQVITSALQEIYNIYKIPYYFVGKTIHVGEYDDKIDVVFKYGVDNSLLSISKNNSNAKIINRITGIGSQDNIPYYYPNDDEKGITRALYNGSTSGVSIVNASKYRKVRLSDKFKFYNTIQTYVPLIDASVYKLGDLRNDGAQDNKSKYSIDFYYSFSLSQQENVQISVTTEYEDNVDLKFEVFKTSGQHIGYFVGDNSLSLTGGTYNLIVRWSFLSDVPMGGIYEYIPSLISQHLNIAANIAVDSTQTWTLNEIPVSLSDYGLSVSQQSNGDIISFERVSYIQPQPNLMPPIYRESLDVFYNALNNTYKDSDGDYYVFDNEYTPNNPKEHIENFDDIKPTIKNVVNANGERIDRFVAFAYDLEDNDETDENGNYLHPYFFAKLRKFNGDFGFNLFDHAIDESEMVVSMTSGTCGSCEFVIGVDSNTQKNTVQVDEYGNLLRDSKGNVRFGSPQDRQNDTENYEVWVALKKDINTFGVIMPNVGENYKPIAGDTFVILHIDLPRPYVTAAENKLEQELLKYMQENNFEKFNFSISFSRIYFAENPSVLKSLTENSSIKIEYNSHVYDLYVSSLSYSMSNDSSLPEIKVELQDAISISQNQLQQVVSSTKKEILSSIETDVFWSNIKGIPSWITNEKPRYSYSELSGATSATDGLWIVKYDANGEPYIYTTFNVVTEKGITMYANNTTLDLPSIYDGLPVDNTSIYWVDVTDEEGNVIDRVLKAKIGSGEGGSATLLGDLENVGAWANALAEEDRIMVQKKGASSWTSLSLEELGTASFENVKESGEGNAYTSIVLSEDKKTLTLNKGESFAKLTDYEALNTKVTAFLEGSDTDNIINKWKELEAFLDGMSESSDLADILSDKADKATTLSGYGITNAYTKNEADDLLDEKADWGTTLIHYGITNAYTKTEADNLLAKKWTQDDNKISNWNTAFGWGDHSKQGYTTKTYVDGKFLPLAGGTITGDLRLRTGSEYTSPFLYFGDSDEVYLKEATNRYLTIHAYKGIVLDSPLTTIDGIEIKKSADGVLYIDANLVVSGGITMYGTDGTTSSSIWDGAPIASTSVKGIASFDSEFFAVNNGKVTFIGETGGGGASSWDDLEGKPSWIGSTKPSYTFSEIGSKPTTLSGYGITDAKILNGVIILGSNTITPLTQTTGDARYITAIGTSGNYLTYTKNGTTHDVTVPYALNADKLDGTDSTGFYKSNAGRLESDELETFVNRDSGGYSVTYRSASTGDVSYSGMFSVLKSGAGSVQAIELIANNYTLKQGALQVRLNVDGTRYSATKTIAFSDGNVATADTASKLSVLDKKAWGQTYWTSGGVPTDISGDMTGVGNITMSGSINSAITINSGDDSAWVKGTGHKMYFGGTGYANQNYYFRPLYGASGATTTNFYIQNASAASSPTFTTTHSFLSNGNASHSGSLTINGIELSKSKDDVLFIDANLVVRGAVTMYGTNSVTASTIMDGILVDGTTIKKDPTTQKLMLNPDLELGGGGISSLTINLGSTSYKGTGTSDVSVSLPAYPTSLKNPSALTITLADGTTKTVYDGSVAKSIALTRLWKSSEVTSATSDDGTITPLAMNQWTTARYITSIGTKDNDLTWTLNGETNKVTVPYATTSKELTSYSAITFSKSDNSGKPCYLLIADVTSWYNVSSGATDYGVAGFVYGHRNGALPAYSMNIAARCAYGKGYYSLNSSLKNIIEPRVVSYNSKYYLALYLQGANRTFNFIGRKNNLLSSFIELQCSDGNGTYSGLSVIYKGSATGTSSKADSLSTSRTISISGHATGSGSFDGSSDLGINVAIPTRKVYINGKGYTVHSTITDDTTGIYAPTSGGTSGYVLKANGATSIPTWVAQSSLSVGTASKLSTERAIWGQSFDGTASVSGDMTGVGSITMSGALSGATTGTFSSTLSGNEVVITNSGGTTSGHLRFSRASANYITIPTGGTLAVNLDGSINAAGSDLIVRDGAVHPGTSGATSLGRDGNLWNGLYLYGGSTSSAFNKFGINFGADVARISANSSGGLGIYAIGDLSKIYLRAGCTTSDASSTGLVIDANGNVQITGNLLVQGGVTMYATSNENPNPEFYAKEIYLTGHSDGRYSKITQGGSYVFHIPTSGTWASGWSAYDDTVGQSLGNAFGMYGSGSTLTYFYYGGTYSSPWIKLQETAMEGTYWKLNDTITNPYLKLVQGSDWYIQGYQGYLYLGAGSTKSLRISSDGSLYTPKTLTQGSDIRHKDIHKDILLSLATMAEAPSIEFHFKDDEQKSTHIGTSAQYWQSVEGVVTEDSEGRLGMDYSSLGVVMGISLAKELSRFESDTDRRIRLLEEENKRLQEEIEKLKTA